MHSTTSWKMLSFLIGLMLLTAGVDVSFGAPKKQREPINVGMIALLASPQKYNGKVIETIGFLNIGRGRESDNLWLHEEDGQLFLCKNSFALDLSDDQRKQFAYLNHTYVVVTGTLHSDGPEGSVMNSGVIVNITQMESWHPYVPTPPKLK
ncbi:MAG: hypothetical protein ABSB50_07830 [Terracidiphilus sp.]